MRVWCERHGSNIEATEHALMEQDGHGDWLTTSSSIRLWCCAGGHVVAEGTDVRTAVSRAVEAGYIPRRQQIA